MHDLHGWAPQATQVSNQWRQDGHPLLIAGAKVSAGLRTCWELGAGSVKLGCLAQIPASWGPSVINVDGEWRVSLTERYHGGDKWNQSHVLHPVGHWYPLPYLTRYGEGQPSTFVPGSIRISGVAYFLDARCLIISWWMNRFTKWDIVPMTPWLSLCMRAVLPLSVCGLCCHPLAAWWCLWIVTHTEPCSCRSKQLCQPMTPSTVTLYAGCAAILWLHGGTCGS